MPVHFVYVKFGSPPTIRVFCLVDLLSQNTRDDTNSYTDDTAMIQLKMVSVLQQMKIDQISMSSDQ